MSGPSCPYLCRQYLVGMFVFAASVWAEDAAGPQPQLTFEKHIRPIFKTYCLDCHGGEGERKGGLDLRLRRFIITGGDAGPAIEPGNAEDSYLYQRIRDGEMPPRYKKLPEKDIRTIANWIAAGAPTARDEPVEIGKGIGITPERPWWDHLRPDMRVRPSFRGRQGEPE